MDPKYINHTDRLTERLTVILLILVITVKIHNNNIKKNKNNSDIN